MDCQRKMLLQYTVYIELTKNITYDNNTTIFIVLSPFLENLNSR